MRVLTGTDIIDIKRIQNSIEKLGDSFLSRVYTDNERAYCEKRNTQGTPSAHKYESYAARFAAKEAVSKALGTGIASGVSLTDIEIINDERGKPCVFLHGSALEYYNNVVKGLSIDVSLSHSDTSAIAFAVILADDM